MDNEDTRNGKINRNFVKPEVYNKGSIHYKGFTIEPGFFINANNLPFAEGNVIKYTCRHKLKGKAEDVKKAIHYLEMILERDYGKV